MIVSAGDLSIEFELGEIRLENAWDMVLYNIGPFSLKQGDRVLYEGKMENVNVARYGYYWAIGKGDEFRYDDNIQGYIACPLLLRTDENGRHRFDWELDKADDCEFDAFPQNEVDVEHVRRLFIVFACTLQRLAFERWHVDIGPFLEGSDYESQLLQVTDLKPLQGCT
jgi:hypothetical protein